MKLMALGPYRSVHCSRSLLRKPYCPTWSLPLSFIWHVDHKVSIPAPSCNTVWHQLPFRSKAEIRYSAFLRLYHGTCTDIFNIASVSDDESTKWNQIDFSAAPSEAVRTFLQGDWQWTDPESTVKFTEWPIKISARVPAQMRQWGNSIWSIQSMYSRQLDAIEKNILMFPLLCSLMMPNWVCRSNEHVTSASSCLFSTGSENGRMRFLQNI